MFPIIRDIYCEAFGGRNSDLVRFVAGVVVFFYFVSMAIDDNAANLSMALKIVIGISMLTSLTAIITDLFGFTVGCNTVSPPTR